MKYNVPYYQAFHIAVCNACQREHSDKYTLISRTKAKEQYLLNDIDLNNLLYLVKPNPHRSSYASMKLYRKSEIESIAFARYGNMDNIDAEKQKRDTAKIRRDEKQRVKRQKQVEREARAAEYAAKYVPPRSSEGVHQHEYRTMGDWKQECTICGFIVEYEEL